MFRIVYNGTSRVCIDIGGVDAKYSGRFKDGMKNILIVLALGISLYGYLENNPNLPQSTSQQIRVDDEQIIKAFENRQSDVQVGGSGRVVAILPDDTKGSQHQKFILELSSGQSVLIAHNIDLAPRIGPLRKGDTVEFDGEYEWGSTGGVVHWTHHDPHEKHSAGWLKHQGKLYQ